MAQANGNTDRRLYDMSVDELKLELSGEFDPHLIQEINTIIDQKTGGSPYDVYSLLH